ncbi:hypothetical protein ACHAW5_008340 [Stephanodiscus triporus]|uniref:Uncharacterized protein n=1 Tax=Stephanodiscus triporus TaxID=2934178 RepID=A0ABD3NX74_9STRA
MTIFAHPHRGRRNIARGQTDEKHVHFADHVSPQHQEYDFNWEFELAYWYSREDMKSFIKTSSSVIRSLMPWDDEDDSHEISTRGIEHFVFPVLQKEMMMRKRELKNMVLVYSRDPTARKKDPEGIKLAEDCAKYSSWVRNVATERGIKYCQMKRGGDKEGGCCRWPIESPGDCDASL